MIEITVLILWIFLAPVIDGLILPEIASHYLPNGVELWVYLVYFGVALLLGLYVYYKFVVDDDQ